MIDDFPEESCEEAEPVEFSPEHKARMAKLFEKPKSYAIFYKIPKRVLIAVLVILTVIVVPLSVKAIREPIFNFFARIFGGERTEFYSSDKDMHEALNSEIETYYKLYYIPDGFELVSEKKTATESFSEYSNGKETFTFEQKKLSENGPQIPETAKDINREYADAPWEITYYNAEGKNTFLWVFGYDEFRLTADETISLDIMKKIADSALSETIYEEKKVLESNNNVSSETSADGALNSPETLPEEFRFELPEGLKVAGWEDNTKSDGKIRYKVFIESDTAKEVMQINICDKTVAQKFTIEKDTPQTVYVNGIAVACFDKANTYLWSDENLTYKIDVLNDGISSEEIIEMIREIYS